MTFTNLTTKFPNTTSVWMVFIALSIPFVALSRGFFGDLGTFFLAGLLGTGSIVLLIRLAASQSLPKSALGLLVSSMPLIIIYANGVLTTPDLESAKNLVQIVMIVVFLLGMSLVNWRYSYLKPFWFVGSFVVFIHLLIWIASGTPRIFSGLFFHPNSLGLFTYLTCFFAVYFFLATPRQYVMKWLGLISVFAYLLLLLATTSRTNWLSFIAMIGTFFIWELISKRRWIFVSYFLFVMCLVLAVTVFYMSAINYQWAGEVNTIVREYTGKNLFSGRQLFWADLGDVILQKPLLGYGAGAEAEDFATTYDMSAHNLYLQTTLQVGLIGLATLILLLGSIWNQFYRGKEHILVRLSASFLIGVIIHGTFEVALTQTNLSTGLTFWLIAGIGLNTSWKS